LAFVGHLSALGSQQFTATAKSAKTRLGVDYNARVLESILKYVAPELGWR